MTHLDRQNRQWYLLPCLFFYVLWGYWVYGSTGDDDSFITYTVAWLLADSGQLVNVNGGAVEQSSSLLQVITLATAHFLTGVQLPMLGLISSVIFGGLCLLLLWRTSPVAALLLMLSPTFVYWAYSGMEVSLQACITLGLVLVVAKRFSKTGTVSAITPERYSTSFCSNFVFIFLVFFYLLIRPEAPFTLLLFLCLFGLTGYFVVQTDKKEFIKKVSILLSITVLLVLLIMACRYFYFGNIFPQPVYAKSSGFEFTKMVLGAFYFISAINYSLFFGLLVVFIAFIFCFRKLPENKKILSVSLLSFLCSGLAFVVASGGDFMRGGRFVAPLIPLLVLLACNFLDKWKYKYSLLTLWVFLSLIDGYTFSKTDSLGVMAPDRKELIDRFNYQKQNYSFVETSNRAHVRNIPALEELKYLVYRLQAQGQAVTLLSGQMGMVPFYLLQQSKADNGRLFTIEFIDRWGLVTDQLVSCPQSKDFRRSRLGIDVSYQDYFNLVEGAACELKKPMIVYDLLNDQDLDQVLKAGYEVIYEQRGVIEPMSGGATVAVSQFIALRHDLASELKIKTKEITY